jgi:hypothetical protein
MSTFRHVNVSSMSPRARTAQNTGISRFKSLREHTRILRVCCPPSSVTRVIIHMNTKMILAAVALSLSLAACAKKEEPAEAAQDAAATANEAAGDAQQAAGDAQQAAGDAANAASDAAAPPAGETTPPADQPPAPPQQ